MCFLLPVFASGSFCTAAGTCIGGTLFAPAVLGTAIIGGTIAGGVVVAGFYFSRDKRSSKRKRRW